MHPANDDALANVLPLSAPTPFGVPPLGTNAWGMMRRPIGTPGAGGWMRQSYPDESGTHQREWPLAELTAETIRERWGEGEYKVCWFLLDPTAQPARVAKGASKIVRFDPEAPRVSPAPAMAAPTGPKSDLERALDFMAIVEQRASSSLSRSLEIATALTRGQGGGLDGATLQLLLQNQQQSMQLLMQQQQQQHEQAMASLRGELAAIRSSLDDGDEEDEPSTLERGAQVASRVVPRIKPGQPIGDVVTAAIGNYLAENPGEVLSVIKSIPSVVEKLSSMTAQAQAAAQAQAQAQQATAPPPPQRPRAMPVQAEPPPPASGFNHLAQVAAAASSETEPAPS